MDETTDMKARQECRERARLEEMRRRRERVVSFQTFATGWNAVEEYAGEPDGQRSFMLSPVIGFVLVECSDRDSYGDYINHEIRPVISNEAGQEITQCPIIPPEFDDKDIPMFVDQTSIPSKYIRYFIQDGDGWRMVDHLPDEQEIAQEK